MKKFALSTFIIATFIIYTIYARATGNNNPQLIANKSSNQIVANNTGGTTTNLTTTPTPNQDNTSPTPASTPTPTPTPTPSSKYKDGTYTGGAADAFYGNIQVQVTISGGKISNINFLQAPNDRSTSVEINSQADPMLAQEAIQAQSANVDIISGATDSSQAFIQSLQSALNQAQK